MFVSFKTNEEMYNKLVERFYTNTNVHELQIIEDPFNEWIIYESIAIS